MAQTRKPELLPAKFRTWEFLPVWMRSLEPLDRVVWALNNTCCKWAPCKPKPKVVKRQDNKPFELEVASCVSRVLQPCCAAICLRAELQTKLDAYNRCSTGREMAVCCIWLSLTGRKRLKRRNLR